MNAKLLIKRIGLGLLLVIIVALAIILTPPSGKPGGQITEQALQLGPFEVVEEDFSVTDTSREMPANPEFDGKDERELNGAIWRPAQSGNYPLIAYSHGFMSLYWEGKYIAEFLASHGYIVVSVNFPLTYYGAPGGAYLADVVNQPGDVSFVLDQVLERNKEEGDSLYQQIDETRIGAAGLSLGGLTTTLVSFDGRWHDPRVKAGVSIAGPSVMFTPGFFETRDIPFMMIAGTSDQLVPYELNGAPILEKDPDSILVSLDKGSHAAFAGVAAYIFRFFHHPDVTACEAIRGNVNRDSDGISVMASEEHGVVIYERQGFCNDLDQLPKAMRTAQQHMHTTLSIYSFFESHFNVDKKARVKHMNFLLNTFPEENSDIQVDINN